MREHEQAKAWRERVGLSIEQLSSMIGYSKEAIYAMERGEATPSRGKPARPIEPNVWRRYKCACAAVDAHLKMQHSFNW